MLNIDKWIFYINFPICGIALVLVPLVVRLKMNETTLNDQLLRVDWIGGFVFIASTTSFLIAISWGGTQNPWDSARTLVPLILGIVGIGAALFWEFRYATQPFLRRTLFHSVSATAGYCAAVVQGCLVRVQSLSRLVLRAIVERSAADQDRPVW